MNLQFKNISEHREEHSFDFCVLYFHLGVLCLSEVVRRIFLGRVKCSSPSHRARLLAYRASVVVV